MNEALCDPDKMTVKQKTSLTDLCMQIAAALKAEKLILMTDVPGVLKDKDDVGTKYAELDIRRVKELVTEGIIAGGMIPK